MDTSTHLEVKWSFDDIVRGGLKEVLGSPLSDAQCEQASLPLASWGFDLRGATSQGSAVNLASASQPLVQAIRGEATALEVSSVVPVLACPQQEALQEDTNLLAQLPVEGAVVDFNSKLRVMLLLEQACSLTQQELFLLVDT